jgi:hypothetical protein
VITHSARGFSDKTAVPVIGIQSIADLDVFNAMLRVIKETAITDNCVLATGCDCKLRRDTRAILVHDLLNESDSLFTFGENA